MSLTAKAKGRLIALALSVAGCLGGVSAGAQVVVYSDAPTTLGNPSNISFHNAAGPVIADDFVPTASGQVTQVRWWGSAVASNTTWELVLQNNDPLLGEPANTPAGNNVTGGVKAINVVATSVAAPAFGVPGLFMYTADFSLYNTFSIAAGTEYWLTVANSANGWDWAEALSGPTVGSENFNAHRSTGPGCTDGGPHCGPWTDIHTDFAMQVTAVPEPETYALILGGLGLIGFLGRRRKSR
jgi:hypothetical protein